MKKFSENSFILTVILLVSSPALSVIGLTGVAFFPNEKLALLLIIFNRSSWLGEFRQLRVVSCFVALILVFLLNVQLLSNTSGMIVASLNSIFIILSFPFYFSYFSSHAVSVFRAIFYVAVIQLFISITQQYFALTGSFETAAMFNNYSYQTDYLFPRGETGFFYRTSGLFKESSSYALFQWLAIIFAVKIGLHKKLWARILLFVMILEVIINGALTGYIFALTFIGISFLNNFKYKSTLVKVLVGGLIFNCILVLLDYNGYFQLSGLIPKIMGQFDFISDQYSESPSRLKGMVQAIELTLNSHFVLWGTGFSWVSPTLDFYSLYMKAYGVIGFLVLFFFHTFLLRRAPFWYKLGVLLVFSVNGHLSMAVNILLLSLPYAILKTNQILGSR